MKKILFLLIFAVPLTMNAQITKRVLFIGNSYTQVNDLPGTIKTLALECGDTLDYQESVPGGSTFQSHLSNATSTALIDGGDYDIVVLQEQSQLPSFPDDQVESECFPYARQLCERIRTANPDANIAFYMTWGRKNGDASNCPYFPPLCTYEGMDSLLYLRYTMMAETNHAILSPVGRVWHVLRDSHPEIELYNADGSHPSPAGTYAAAVTFYTILFLKSPACITNSLSIDEASAEIIRETVQTVVYDSLAFWYRYAVTTDGIHEEELEGGTLLVYPNPVRDICHLSLRNISVHSSMEVRVLDACGKSVLSQPMSSYAAQIDFSTLPSGVYFIQTVADGQLLATGKVIKIKEP